MIEGKKVTMPRHGKIGAGTRSRTRDLLITNQLLYQLSYTGNNLRGLLHRQRADYTH